ncbi:hypothetical protein KGV52_01885, partial [Candidatus Gracilibacteria bacterium]|nr:hypothetical protein [Candidatus Gracilibacteria bacterium]
ENINGEEKNDENTDKGVKVFDYNFLDPKNGNIDWKKWEEAKQTDEELKAEIKKEFQTVDKDFEKTRLRSTVTLNDGTLVRTIYPEELQGIQNVTQAKQIIKKRIQTDGYVATENGNDIIVKGKVTFRIFTKDELNIFNNDKYDKYKNKINNFNSNNGNETCWLYIAGYEPLWKKCRIQTGWFTTDKEKSKAICFQEGTWEPIYKSCGNKEYENIVETWTPKLENGNIVKDESGNQVFDITNPCNSSCPESDPYCNGNIKNVCTLIQNNCPKNTKEPCTVEKRKAICNKSTPNDCPFDYNITNEQLNEKLQENIFAKLTYNDLTSCNHTQFADGVDSCDITLELFGGRTGLADREGNSLSGLKADKFNYTGAKLDQVTLSGNKSGLIFPKSGTFGTEDTMKLTIKSIVPFDSKDETIKFFLQSVIDKTPQAVKVDGISLNFQKPINHGSLTVGTKGDESPQLGKLQSYNLQIELEDRASSEKMKNFELTLKEEDIVVSNGFEILKMDFPKKTFIFDSIPSTKRNGVFENIFKLRIDATKEAKRTDLLGKNLTVSVKKVQLSYEIEGEKVTYLLDNPVTTSANEKNTLGLQVQGVGQSDKGRGNLTGQEINRTKVQLPKMRSDIRKNAFTLIRSREYSQKKTINRVYYKDGNTTYSDIQDDVKDYDTIIIKDGNFIIDKNIDKKVGIIVISDKFETFHLNKNANFDIIQTQGNIFITKNVGKINAVIYADGSLISADKQGKSYSDDELTKPLRILGSIFTKNTVGGAAAGAGRDGTYLLPNGKNTKGLGNKLEQFNIAQKYDLNYLRKANLNTEKYSVKIESDPDFKLHTPTGFKNKID